MDVIKSKAVIITCLLAVTPLAWATLPSSGAQKIGLGWTDSTTNTAYQLYLLKLCYQPGAHATSPCPSGSTITYNGASGSDHTVTVPRSVTVNGTSVTCSRSTPAYVAAQPVANTFPVQINVAVTFGTPVTCNIGSLAPNGVSIGGKVPLQFN